MYKKGSSQVWLISIVSILSVIVGGYFIGMLLGLWSIGGTGIACDITTTEIISETSEGVWLQLGASGCYGGQNSEYFSKIKNFTFKFSTSPHKYTDYEYLKKIDGKFALSTEEFISDEATVVAIVERNVWSNNICYGDWAKTGQTAYGIATCKAEGRGTPSNPNFNDRNDYDTVGLVCQIEAPFGDESYPCSQKMFDVNSASIKIFIPYSNIECLDDSMCEENYTCSEVNACVLKFEETSFEETSSQDEDVTLSSNPDADAEENSNEEIGWFQKIINWFQGLFANWKFI
jgi:hypothetical protein